ncbi:MAG: beta-galactosidase [Chloroflexia bacterium]|nr:beta-galactosidase [Chloroflexia bacterium]
MKRFQISHPAALFVLVLPLLGGLLVGLLGYQPPAPPQTPAPLTPQVVQTRNPKLGVHTRLTDEVEAAKIARSLRMVREMGSPWIVELFPWSYIQPEQGRFDWQHADLVIGHARAQGLQVIARLDIVPAWARPAHSSTRYLDREHYPDYARFVESFVRRYRGQVDYIIVWNEPNLAFEWGGRVPDPAAYAELLREVYPRAKAANPDVIVLAAGLAPTVELPEGGRAYNDLLYLQAMYDAGARPYFDALAAHAYGWQAPFEQRPDPGRVNFRRVQFLHTVMKRNGDGDKPVYITEAGWNDHPRWVKAVRPAERIQYTLEAAEWALSQDWLACLAFWQFRLPWSGSSAQVYFSLVGHDFTPRPIYLELQQYARGGETP